MLYIWSWNKEILSKKNSHLLHHEHYVMYFDGCQCTEITVKEKSNVNTHKLWHYKFINKIVNYNSSPYVKASRNTIKI